MKRKITKQAKYAAEIKMSINLIFKRRKYQFL